MMMVRVTHHDENDGVWPCAVDVLDKVHIGMIEISWGNFIGVAVVVSA
jgi:hypothetical protein